MAAMQARLVPALPGTILAVVSAWLTFAFLAGGAAGTIAALVTAAIAMAVGVTAPTPRNGAARQLALSAALLVFLAAALFVFGADYSASPLPAGPMLAAGFIASLACVLAILRHREESLALEAAALAARVEDEDPDRTLELEVVETAPPAVSVNAGNAFALRIPLLSAVALAVVLLLTGIYWVGDDHGRGGVATAAPLSLPAPAPPAVAPPPDPAPVGPAMETAPLADEPEEAAGSNVPAGVDASAARRECMAQIEAANLFLRFAREAADEESYGAATAPQIERLLAEKPVGPRTLSRIAERMWTLRDAPDRDAGWWSGQYARCEESRLAGAWYVVRG